MMLMTRRLFVLLFLLVSADGALFAQPNASPDPASLGPQVGTRVPTFSGIDQFGRPRTLQSVLGEQGAMVVFFRSADW